MVLIYGIIGFIVIAAILISFLYLLGVATTFVVHHELDWSADSLIVGLIVFLILCLFVIFIVVVVGLGQEINNYIH